MKLLKHILTENELSQSIADIDDFMKENSIGDDAMVQSIIFNKNDFTKADSTDWALSHDFYSEVIEENDDSFAFVQMQADDFESLSDIEILNGVKIRFGDIRQFEEALTLTNGESGIKFSESLPQIIELARVVDGYHPSYGSVEITKEMLRSFKDNFDNNVVGVDIMIDFSHEQEAAASWIKEVFLSYDQETLLGVVRWTEKGAQALSSGAFRYISPEFTGNYVHPHTNVNHGPTLLGGGLVNRPFLKMDAIVAFSEGNNNNNEKENGMSTILLTEHNAKVTEFEDKIKTVKLSEEKAQTIAKNLKEENVKLSEELGTIKKDKAEQERLAENDDLFNKGKINKAQLVALNEGKPFKEVLMLAENMNTAPEGKNVPETGAVKLSEAEQEAARAMDMTDEEFVKYGK